MGPPPLLVGISGPSSSGKTTLSRLLRDIFPPSKLFILHLDDFYLDDADIPIKDDLQDWDCVESLNLKQLKLALLHIKEHGNSPDWLVSKEDQNNAGEHGVPDATILRLRQDVARALDSRMEWNNRRVYIVDGFLLFSEAMHDIQSLFDVKLFLRTSYTTAKRRREARSGYVTLQGFWQDPPGYVDKIVWPNYIHYHKVLFKDGDVEGDLDQEVCSRANIQGMPCDAEENMPKCLDWASDILTRVVEAS